MHMPVGKIQITVEQPTVTIKISENIKNPSDSQKGHSIQFSFGHLFCAQNGPEYLTMKRNSSYLQETHSL